MLLNQFLDGKIISAPSINEPIIAGSGVISGNFTFETANDLAILLRAGSLPAPISIAEERTVGPSLGKDSIKAGSVSLMIAFGLVLVYMFLIYGKVAFIANSVLIINILFLVSKFPPSDEYPIPPSFPISIISSLLSLKIIEC